MRVLWRNGAFQKQAEDHLRAETRRRLRYVAAALRRELEKTRLGRRVLCTDQHLWSTGRIVHAFRGQWNVEELFRRSKKGGVVPWGPSHQWADGSLRLHTFATVLGLMLVSLAEDRARNRRLRSKDDERTRRDPRNIGAYDHARARAPGDRDACAGTQHPTAPGCERIRTGPLDAHTSFMYDNPTHSYMIDPIRDQIHLPLMRR